jgi:hypothetical protein
MVSYLVVGSISYEEGLTQGRNVLYYVCLFVLAFPLKVYVLLPAASRSALTAAHADEAVRRGSLLSLRVDA